MKILGELISFNTAGYNYEEKQACIAYVENHLKQYDLHLSRHENNNFPSLVASTRTAKTPHILLQAHLDVVPAKAESLRLTDKDGRLYGRGAYDMKFAAAIYLQLVEELKDELHELDFALMFTTDEEIGGKDGVGYLVRQGYLPGVCIIPDGGDDWQIEEKCNDVWITSLIADGKSAHGSRPWEGENAIYKLLEALADIRHLFGEQRPFKNSLTISQIQGGMADNQVPEHAKASLDMRFTDHDQYLLYRRTVEGIAESYGLHFGKHAIYDGRRVPLSDPEIRNFMGIAEGYLGEKIIPTQSLGSSDAIFYAEQDIPTIVIRPEGGAAHSDDEWISRQGFLDFYEVLEAYVKRFAATGKSSALLDNAIESVTA